MQPLSCPGTVAFWCVVITTRETYNQPDTNCRTASGLLCLLVSSLYTKICYILAGTTFFKRTEGNWEGIYSLSKICPVRLLFWHITKSYISHGARGKVRCYKWIQLADLHNRCMDRPSQDLHRTNIISINKHFGATLRGYANTLCRRSTFDSCHTCS